MNIQLTHRFFCVITVFMCTVAAHFATAQTTIFEARETSDKFSRNNTQTKQLLWSAGMETGDLSEWETSRVQKLPCGGQFNNDISSFSVASKDYSHSGLWSAKLEMPSKGGTRLHRWCESRPYNPDLIYTIWLFVPTKYTIHGWANWIQFKSKKPGGGSDPFFFLDVRNRKDELKQMYFLLTWWSGLKIEGPHKGEFGYRTWESPVDIPINRWFRVSIRYVSADDFSGSIYVEQDNIKIFRLENIKTRYNGGETQLGVNSYGENITPAPVVIYADDVSISMPYGQK